MPRDNLLQGMKTMPKTQNPVLEVNRLNKDFKKQPVLRNMSFSVHAGEIFGFLGPNGAGKTTTIRILLGLTLATSGDCRIFGQSIDDNGEIRRRIGVVFEQPNIYERLSGRQNLQFYASLYDVGNAEVERLLADFDLLAAANKAVRHYSKGMRQRLLLCRALVHDPELLIMDEPTGGLDPTSQQSIRDAIVRMSEQGKTIFLSTHSLEEADQICHRVAVLYQGQLAAIDKPQVLKQRYGQPAISVTLRPHSVPDVPSIRRWCVSNAIPMRLDEDGSAQMQLPIKGNHWGRLLDELTTMGTVTTVHSQEATLNQVYHRLTSSEQG